MQTQLTAANTHWPPGEATCGCHTLSQAPEATQLVHSHPGFQEASALSEKSGGQCVGGGYLQEGPGQERGVMAVTAGGTWRADWFVSRASPRGLWCSGAMQADSGEDAGVDR